MDTISVFKQKITSGWRNQGNGYDCIFWPNSEKKNEARNHFGISYGEEIIFLRDTGFWNSADQGLVITDKAIYCIPDNEKPDQKIIIPFEVVKNVYYKDMVLFFEDSTDQPWTIHLSFFVKNTDSSGIDYTGRNIASLLNEICTNTEDPVETSMCQIEDLISDDNFDKAIPLINQCINSFPDYSGYFNERLACCQFFKKNYYDAIRACDNALQNAEYGSEAFSKVEFWKYSAYEELNDYVNARKSALMVARFGSDEKNEEGKSLKEYATDAFFDSQAEFAEHFLEMPYRDRKAVMFVSTWNNLNQSSIQLLGTEDASKFNFSIGHPIENEIYIGHPLIPEKYMPLETYQLELVEDKVREFCQLAQSLGATEINIECLNSSTNDHTHNGNVRGSGKVDTYVDISGSASRDYSKHMIDELSHSISLHQTFEPHALPQKPEGMVYFDSEPSWQRLLSQRINGGLTSHEERIETKKSQLVEGREMNSIKADVESLFVDMGITFDKTEQQKYQLQENAVLSIKVKFAPLSQLRGAQPSTTPTSLAAPDQFTDSEKEYLDEVKECLAEGEIGQRERRLLEKLRVKLGITSERAVSLENSLKPSLTDDEKEYLEEYKSIISDGEITPRERRLLDKLRTMLDISEARAKEIESLI